MSDVSPDLFLDVVLSYQKRIVAQRNLRGRNHFGRNARDRDVRQRKELAEQCAEIRPPS